MKKEVTKKYLKAVYGNDAIYFSDGAAQTLFPSSDADYYTCGVYGWNFDAWAVNGYLINSGYRGSFGIYAPYELTKKYNQKAEELRAKYTFSSEKDYREYKEKLYLLQKEFIKVVLNEK